MQALLEVSSVASVPVPGEMHVVLEPAPASSPSPAHAVESPGHGAALEDHARPAPAPVPVSLSQLWRHQVAADVRILEGVDVDRETEGMRDGSDVSYQRPLSLEEPVTRW